jgi:hypothetical protein
MATPSYGALSSYDVQAQDIARRQKYAELLQQQSQEAPQGSMVSGWYVAPSWTQGLNKVAQGVLGKYQEKKADQDALGLSEKYRTDLANTIRQAGELQTGRPAQSFQTPANEMGDEAATQNVPARAPDPMAAAQAYMQHPATQALGMQMAQQEAQRQQWANLLGGNSGTTSGQAPASDILGGTGISKQDAQAALLADPTGKLLTEKILAARAENNKPILQREGDVLRRNPDGSVTSIFSSPKMEPGMLPQRGPNGQVVGAAPIPGYAQGVAGMKGLETGAVEDAKANRDMVTVQTPQGPRMMTRAQAVQMSGGQTPQQQWLGQEPKGAFQGDPEVIAQQINAIRDPAERAAAARAFNNQMQGGGKPAALPGIALQNPSDTKMSDELNQLGAKEVFDSNKSASKAVEQLNAIYETRKAIDGGAFQGTGAGAKTDIAKFAKGVFGIDIDPTKTSNSDYMRSTLGSQILAQAKALGTNPSNTDAKRIEDIVGNIDKDPEALNKILEWQESMIRKSVSGHNSNIDQMDKKGFKAPYDLRVKLPDAYVPQRRAVDKVPVKRFNPATGKIE